ncbi:MAG: hypothetical protein AB9856_20090 [Cellulosilyticaceae bacterium]
MTTREATKTYRINQWTQIICECRSSGQTVKVWCAEHNIEPKKYYYWLSQVRKAATQALPSVTNDSSIIPIHLPKSELALPAPSQTGGSNDVVATISVGNAIIQLSNQASSDFILNVMKAMQHVR